MITCFLYFGQNPRSLPPTALVSHSSVGYLLSEKSHRAVNKRSTLCRVRIHRQARRWISSHRWLLHGWFIHPFPTGSEFVMSLLSFNLERWFFCSCGYIHWVCLHLKALVNMVWLGCVPRHAGPSSPSQTKKPLFNIHSLKWFLFDECTALLWGKKLKW